MEFGLILFVIGLFVLVASWGFDDSTLGMIIAIILIVSSFYIGFGTSSGEPIEYDCYGMGQTYTC